MEECKRIFGKNDQILYSKSPLGSVNKADCLAIITEWKEFRGIDINELGDVSMPKFYLMEGIFMTLLFMIKNGFTYYGIGRGKSIYE